MAQPEIFFIVGVQRSGTTLLRSILHSHPEICAGYECSFYKRLIEVYPNGISIPEDIDKFLTSLFSVRRFEHWNLSSDQIRNELLTSIPSSNGWLSYPEAIKAVGLCLRNVHKPDARYLGYKNPNGIFHCDFILNLFPKAKILHISRDPRGVLASEKKKRIKAGRYEPSHTIWTVAKRYKNMLIQHDTYKDDPRYIQIWYEDLINNFEPTASKLIQFLGLEFHEDLLVYHLQAQRDNFTPEVERWQHSKTLEAPDQSRTSAFLNELTNSEISTLELLCRNELKLLGLDRTTNTNTSGLLGLTKIFLDKGIRMTSGKRPQGPRPIK